MRLQTIHVQIEMKILVHVSTCSISAKQTNEDYTCMYNTIIIKGVTTPL